MTAKKVLVAMIDTAREKAKQEISGIASRGGKCAGPLAGEGYAGGYAEALGDVLLLLNGVRPNRRNYWTASRPAQPDGSKTGQHPER